MGARSAVLLFLDRPSRTRIPPALCAYISASSKVSAAACGGQNTILPSSILQRQINGPGVQITSGIYPNIYSVVQQEEIDDHTADAFQHFLARCFALVPSYLKLPEACVQQQPRDLQPEALRDLFIIAVHRKTKPRQL